MAASKRHFVREYVGDEVIRAALTTSEQDFTLPNIVLTIPSGATVETARLDFELYSCYSPSSNLALLIVNASNPMKMTIEKAPGAETDAMVWPANANERYALGKDPAAGVGASNGGSTFKGTEELATYLNAQGAGTYTIRFRKWKINVANLLLYGVPVLVVEYSISDVASSADLAVVDGVVDAVLVDTADMQPRVVAIEADTNEIQGKLPTNKIMGSSDVDDHDTDIDAILVDTSTTIPATLTTIEGKIDVIDTEVGVIDGIVDDIKEAIRVEDASVVADGGNTATTFKTDLANANNDFYNNLQILFLTGNNAKQARRITDYVGGTKFITVSEAFQATPSGGDDFIIIGRVAGAGSSLTEAGIADAVWDEQKAGHVVANSFGKVLQDVETDVDAVLVDTNEIQGKLPSKAYLRGTADSDGGMDSEDKADINAEADQALVDYDPPTRAEATSDKDEIITEVNANETKIDAMQADITSIEGKVDVIDGIVDAILVDTGTTLPAQLSTHDADIKALIGTPSVDLSADIAANLAAIQAVQNNTRFTAAVPNPMQKPDSGNQAYRHASNLYDTQGDMEDPDNSEILVRIIKNDGTFITANLYKENALSNALDNPTDTGTFPPASGWRKMEREAVGKYFFFYKVASDETEESLTVEFGWDEGGQVNYQSRATKISDTTGDIEAILTEVIAIGVKVDSGTPSPTIPGQITTHDTDIKADIATHDTDIKALPNVKATPEYLVVPSGVTAIDNEGGVTNVATTIPVKDASQLEDEGVVLIESEYIIYTSIVSNVLTGCTRGAYGSSNVTHADAIAVYEVFVYPIRLSVFDGEGNMVTPDSAPTIQIDDWNGNTEVSPTAMTLISTGLYGYNYVVPATARPEPKNLIFVIVVNSITTDRENTLMLLDEPAKEATIIQLLGGGSGKMIINQDGYIDTSGIFHAWTDAMVGYLHDDTGSRLSDVIITAYEVIGGKTVIAVIPPGQAKSDNGNYEMRLNAGTYVFKFDHDQYRFPVPEVTRTVTE